MDPSRHTAVVIGCGSIGSRHVRNLSALGAVRILTLDTDLDRAREAAAQVACAEAFDSADAVWAQAPDIAVIAVPTALHVPLAREAAQHGCHLFVEKPVSHTIDGVAELAAFCRDRGLVAAVGYNWRFNPVIARVGEMLSTGALGRPLWAYAHFGSYLPARHPWEDYRAGYGARADLGGGVLLDAVTHQLDYLTHLFGEPRDVMGRTGRRSDLEIDVDDVADLIVTLGGGLVATVHGDFVERPHRASLEVVCKEGTLLADFVASEIRFWIAEAGEWTVERLAYDYNDIYVDEMRHFLACVDGKAEPGVGLDAGLRNLRALLAARRSSETGEAVVL